MVPCRMSKPAVFVLTMVLLCQAGQARALDPLTVSRMRAVSYKGGPLREGTTIQPFEKLVVLCDVNGAAKDEAGKVSTLLKYVWMGPNGQVVGNFSTTLNAIHPFGGPIPAVGELNIPPRAPIGKYTLHLTVEDQISRRSTNAKYSVDLTPMRFDIINLRLLLNSKDGPGRPGRFYVYDVLYMPFNVVGFSIPGGRVRIRMDATLEDEMGGLLYRFDPIRLDQPLPANTPPVASFNLSVNLSRPGRFFMAITITDEHNGQTVMRKVPFTVEAAN